MGFVKLAVDLHPYRLKANNCQILDCFLKLIDLDVVWCKVLFSSGLCVCCVSGTSMAPMLRTLFLWICVSAVTCILRFWGHVIYCIIRFLRFLNNFLYQIRLISLPGLSPLHNHFRDMQCRFWIASKNIFPNLTVSLTHRGVKVGSHIWSMAF